MTDPLAGDRPALTDLPSLEELGVSSETMEVAEEIAASSDVPGLERHSLELLVRAVVYLHRSPR